MLKIKTTNLLWCKKMRKICKTPRLNGSYNGPMGIALTNLAETDASKCYLDKQAFVDMLMGQHLAQLSGCDTFALDLPLSDQHLPQEVYQYQGFLKMVEEWK